MALGMGAVPAGGRGLMGRAQGWSGVQQRPDRALGVSAVTRKQGAPIYAIRHVVSRKMTPKGGRVLIPSTCECDGA